jgi:alpha-galactosidase
MGMAALGDAAHKRGFKFLLWFAPETYPEGCTVVSDHPEYIITYPGKKGGIPDLLNNEAFDYFLSYFDECIKSWHMDVFRTDSGYDPGILWAHEPEARTGIWEMKYVEALYRLWDKLRDQNPGLVIDNCCGGGTRLDLELCSRSISVWRTDTSVWYGVGDNIRSPILGQTFSASFNRFIPFHQNATYDYDPYTMRSGFNGGITFYMDIRRPDFDRNIANKAFCEVRRLRKYLTGDFYRLVFDSYNPYSWCAYQYHLPESNEGAVFIFRRDASPYPVCEIQLKAVYEGKKYEVDFYYGYDKNRTEYLSGSELKSLTVSLSGAPASLLLEYRERPKFSRK